MFEPGHYVTAERRLKDAARRAEARSALTELVRATLIEPGCTLFTVHEDRNDPARFVLWERFADAAAFRQHFEEPHTKAYLARDLTEVARAFTTNVATG